MGVHELWSELLDATSGGWSCLSRWRAEVREEGLHLDFKQGSFVAGTPGNPAPDDLKNLAKGISGFANVEGGLLVFGAKTAPGAAKQDQLNALTCVDPVELYAERLRVHVKDATTPQVAGVEVRAFVDPAANNRGVVVVRIPFSDGGPYRAEGSRPDVSGRYFMRTTSDTIVMPHQVLAGMFGRTPPPHLRVLLERHPSEVRTIILHVENTGRGSAISPFVRLKLPMQASQVFIRGDWQERRFEVMPHGWTLAFSLPAQQALYPGEVRTVAVFDVPGESIQVTARTDCANALPFEWAGSATLVAGVRVPLDEET